MEENCLVCIQIVFLDVKVAKIWKLSKRCFLFGPLLQPRFACCIFKIHADGVNDIVKSICIDLRCCPQLNVWKLLNLLIHQDDLWCKTRTQHRSYSFDNILDKMCCKHWSLLPLTVQNILKIIWGYSTEVVFKIPW